jgi:hypothetical protein
MHNIDPSAADFDALVEDLVATIRHPDLWRRRCQVDKELLGWQTA